MIASYQMSADLGMVIGPILIGLIAERGSYALALGCTAGLLALAGLMSFFMPHPNHTENKK
ncbi:Major Facilitator Superfamily protein [compost metagenome]